MILTIARLGIIIGISYVFIEGPLRPYKIAFYNNKAPQSILVLGGDAQREYIGLRLAKSLQIPIILSGGSNPEYAKWLLKESQLSTDLITFDYQANDTFENFKFTVNKFQEKNINHILLITSVDHLPRASIVGGIIAGSRGIRVTTIPIECAPNCINENIYKQYFDYLRALIWVTTEKDIRQLIKSSAKFISDN